MWSFNIQGCLLNFQCFFSGREILQIECKSSSPLPRTCLSLQPPELLSEALVFLDGEGNGTPLQYSCLENPVDGGAWQVQSTGSLRVKHDSATSLSLFTFMHWRRKWQPTPVFLPGESKGWRSLVGCRLWGPTESDTTEATQPQQQQFTLNMSLSAVSCMS